jgi:hypothetical protein
MSKMQTVALVAWLSASPALAAETIEAIGGEKCGGAVAAYAVEFLAPDNAEVEARVKALVGGSEDASRNTTALSLDGKACTSGRCAFSAEKGKTYKLAAKSAGPKVEALCISVSRP